MNQKIKGECKTLYKERYAQYVSEYTASAVERSRNHAVSESRRSEIERDAQRDAIKDTLSIVLAENPLEDASSIWRHLYEAHIHRKSGIDNKEVIDSVISADQSWKKASGHAFEGYIKNRVTNALRGWGIEFILQRDLSLLLRNEELSNHPRDYEWLQTQARGSVFDLYATVTRDEKKYCFGCVQSKTSIRDRVTRDREPSIQAMQHFFWSIVIVLDGDFLRMPKFIGMANGGTDEFPTNGWHGVYVLSHIENNDRIYGLERDLSPLDEHAQLAAQSWLEQRQWLNEEWIAQTTV